MKGPFAPMRVFHVTLGAVVCWQSVVTVHEGWPAVARHPHPVLVGAVEAVAAVMFLLPRTRTPGGWLLLAVFAFALVVHGLQHQFASSLLIDAAGVWLVLRAGRGA